MSKHVNKRIKLYFIETKVSKEKLRYPRQSFIEAVDTFDKRMLKTNVIANVCVNVEINICVNDTVDGTINGTVKLPNIEK